MKFFSRLFNTLRSWFHLLFSADSRVSRLEDISAKPTFIEPAVLVGHRISGYADCPNADIALAGYLSRNTTANDASLYSFEDLPNGTYIVKPSTDKPGKTFYPEIQIVTISGADVLGVDFIDPSSPVDSRAITATTPNSSRTVQGSLIYDVQKAESRSAGAPVDCRVASNIPIDSRVSPNIPQNSSS